MSALRSCLAALAVLSWVGCSNAIVFTTGTQVGIEVNGVEGGKQVARIGYNRGEFAVMPVRRADGTLRKEAYSVLAVLELKSGPLLLGGLTKTELRQVFATGAAAKKASALRTVQESFAVIRLGEDDSIEQLHFTGPADERKKEFDMLYREARRDSDWIEDNGTQDQQDRAEGALKTLREATGSPHESAFEVLEALTVEDADSLRPFAERLAEIRAEPRIPPSPAPDADEEDE